MGFFDFFTPDDTQEDQADRGPSAGGLSGLLSFNKAQPARPDSMAAALPYDVYYPDDKLFGLGSSCGFLIEVRPQTGADEAMAQTLRGAIQALPVGAGLQITLLATPHVGETLRRSAELRREDADQREKAEQYSRPARNSNFFRMQARSHYEYLANGALKSPLKGLPFLVRDFRIMLSVTLPFAASTLEHRERAVEIRTAVLNTLFNAGFAHLVCDADALIEWTANFLNPDRLNQPYASDSAYDPGREVRQQIVDINTVHDEKSTVVRVMKKGTREDDPDTVMEVRGLTVTRFPKRWQLFRMSYLIGDMVRPQSQYPDPFAITIGIEILDKAKAGMMGQAMNMRAQQNARGSSASYMTDVGPKAEDWSKFMAVITQSGRSVRLYQQVLLFRTHPSSHDPIQGAVDVWRDRGFTLTPCHYLHRAAILASLPMTASREAMADRHKLGLLSTKTDANAVNMSPLLADSRGTSTPSFLTVSRRGQIQGWCLFDNRDGNANMSVVGPPGSGKSVTLQYIMAAYLGQGAKVRYLDFGRSALRTAKMQNAVHMAFGESSRVVINPFSFVTEPRLGEDGRKEGGIEEDIEMIAPAMAVMASPRGLLTELQVAAMRMMILRTYRQYGREANPTAVASALATAGLTSEDDPQLVEELSRAGVRAGDERLRDMALMLASFCKDGEYARFFNSVSNLDLTSDYMVLEMEELARKPQLQQVVNTILWFSMTAEMYLNRTRRKLIVIDEIKSQIGAQGQNNAFVSQAIDELGRRVRKYGGSLITASHFLADYYSSEQMRVALATSDWKLLLRTNEESVAEALKEGYMGMNEGVASVLRTLKKDNHMAEGWLTNPLMGSSVVRIMLDPFFLLASSNRLEDNKPLDELMAQGMAPTDAVQHLLNLRSNF